MTFDPKDYKLVILVKDSDSAPLVYGEGELVENKTRVTYLWETKTEMLDSGVHQYDVNYWDTKSSSKPIQRGFAQGTIESAFAEDIE